MERSIPEKRDFVHLHLHSNYSLLQSTVQLRPLTETLGKLGMTSCAVTDSGNMYGALSFYRELKYAGLKPIIGYEANVASGSHLDRSSTVSAGERPYYGLVLLARNVTGYQNLVLLASKAFTDGFHHKPRIDLELLQRHKEGLIVLSGGWNSALDHFLGRSDEDRAREYASRLLEIFGPESFYIEIERHGLEKDDEVIEKKAAIAKDLGIGLVAANNVHYLNEDDAEAQEILLCIGEGRTMKDPGRPTLPGSGYHVRSPEEMWELFGDSYPDALLNTVKIADQCELELSVGGKDLILPIFPIPEESGCSTLDDYLEKVVREGFEARRRELLDPLAERGELKYTLDEYENRLRLELETINGMGYSGYFLIVWEFIKYAMQQGIPVGPGRGSAAGSLVAYCLEITDVDPLQYDLFFERFLNPERVSMPDIDIDFCIRGRADVINHVSELYGRDSVCQIITFGTLQSKQAIKDTGRALEIPLAEVEKIAGLIPPPFRGRITSIPDALEKEPRLKEATKKDPKVKELIDIAMKIEGCARHTSVHAAGVVIAPKPVREIVPVAVSHKNELTSQYPMGDLEKVGLLKMDFLGLTTLTIISDCQDSIREKTGIEIDWREVPLDDKSTMAIFSEGKTDAIFQFESSGMQEICRRLKPKTLEDLAALNALYRPGPIDGGMIEDFIARHRGEKKVEYLVPEMEGILRNTYGVLVYQEQIMQLAQTLAGYSLGEADLMRRAMGKKKKEEMVPHEKKFIGGAVARGISKNDATSIFNLMSQFADYGFNRSHSIAYAILAFRTGYLKAHFPAYFYASVLSHEANDSAKIYKYSQEMRSIGLELLPPDVNESDDGFTPGDGSVRFGLTAIKGMGSTSAIAILEARKQGGSFASLFDLVSRVEQANVNRRTLESLVSAGACDSMIEPGMTINQFRGSLHNLIPDALSYGQSVWNDRISGQSGLFGGNSSAVEVPSVKSVGVEWDKSELALRERSAIGFYLSAHPLDEYESTLSSLNIKNVADIQGLERGVSLTAAGIVSGLQIRWTQKGERYAQFQLEDRSTGIKCLVWSDTLSRFADAIENGELLMVSGKVREIDGQDITLTIGEVKSLADSISRNARKLTITLPAEFEMRTLDEIYSALSSAPGRCDVLLQVQLDSLNVTLKVLPLSVQGSGKLENTLKSLGCKVQWEL